MKPVTRRQRQSEPPALHELRDFPTGDRAHAEHGRLVPLDEALRQRRKPVVTVHPPDPDVGVEQDHREDSHSPSATLRNGSTYSTGMPARGERPDDGAAGAVDTGWIVTSTACPARKGSLSTRTELTPSRFLNHVS